MQDAEGRLSVHVRRALEGGREEQAAPDPAHDQVRRLAHVLPARAQHGQGNITQPRFRSFDP